MQIKIFATNPKKPNHFVLANCKFNVAITADGSLDEDQELPELPPSINNSERRPEPHNPEQRPEPHNPERRPEPHNPERRPEPHNPEQRPESADNTHRGMKYYIHMISGQVSPL